MVSRLLVFSEGIGKDFSVCLAACALLPMLPIFETNAVGVSGGSAWATAANLTLSAAMARNNATVTNVLTSVGP